MAVGERNIQARRTAASIPSSRTDSPAGTARALRRHLVEDRGLAKPSVDCAGYWRLSLTQDDAPTPEDLAEARERLTEAQR